MKQGRVFPKLFAGLVVSLALAVPAFALETFNDEAKAQQHCPKDVVVWLNLPTMIWHYKGQRWYANTIHGAYAFPYFMSAGINIFSVPKLRDTGAVLGQLSFASGMACVFVMGLFYGLHVFAVLCGCILALCSVMLYEWSRRTVVDRNFYVGLAGEVPPAVCDSGPYRLVRHPFYLSYMAAFLGVAVAFPSFIVAGVCAANIGLFVYMAIDDERMLHQSPLAADYESYKVRVGMFLPRLAAKR